MPAVARPNQAGRGLKHEPQLRRALPADVARPNQAGRGLKRYHETTAPPSPCRRPAKSGRARIETSGSVLLTSDHASRPAKSGRARIETFPDCSQIIRRTHVARPNQAGRGLKQPDRAAPWQDVRRPAKSGRARIETASQPGRTRRNAGVARPNQAGRGLKRAAFRAAFRAALVARPNQAGRGLKLGEVMNTASCLSSPGQIRPGAD